MFLRSRGIGILGIRCGGVTLDGNVDEALGAGLRMGGKDRCAA